MDSIPAIAMVFPISYGSKTQKSFYQKGIYSQSLPLSASGNSIVEADSYGSLIMHDGDTLRNVLRVHKCYSSYMRMSKFNNGLPIDTIRDTLVKHIEDVYSWYEEEYRYPIVETVKHIYMDKDKVIDNFGKAFLCTLEEQTSKRNDNINIKERVKVRWITQQDNKDSSNYRYSELFSDEHAISQTDENTIVKATQLFEFLANPKETTNVEWSHNRIGSVNSRKNIVETTHQGGKTAQGDYLNTYGYTIKEDIHSHPGGTDPSRTDFWIVNRIAAKNKNAYFSVYIGNGKYIYYASDPNKNNSKIEQTYESNYLFIHTRIIYFISNKCKKNYRSGIC
jgi:hypothetical protein